MFIIRLLLLLPVFALAIPVKDTLQMIEVGKGTTAIKLSKSDPNRLTVQGDTITSIACMHRFCVNTIRHKEADALLVLDTLAQSSTGFSFYVTTASGKTIPLLGVPEDIAGQTVEIKTTGGSLKAKAFETKNPYTTTLMTVIKKMMRFLQDGVTPEGYAVADIKNETAQNNTHSGLAITPTQAFSGDRFNGLVYSVKNNTNEALTLTAEQFYYPGVLAAAIEHEQLLIGGITRVFLVTESEAV